MNIHKKILWCLADKRAKLPEKFYSNDVGYDLPLINVEKQDGDLILFTTGVQVCPPTDYYFEIIPRSSIFKTGYLMANGIGIIDPGYTGILKVPLLKIDKTKPDLILPCRVVQLVLRKLYSFEIVEVEQLPKTKRGEFGFGSTGV